MDAPNAAVIIGAGGLGGPVAMALASAGIERLTLCDPDVVELSNLHRQLQFTNADVGRPKVDCLAQALIRRGFPADRVRRLQVSFDDHSAAHIIGSADVVVEGSDDFNAKFAANDTAHALRVPTVIAAVSRHAGTIARVNPQAPGGCYRCLFESPPPAAEATSCAHIGVWGAATALVAGYAAREALCLLGAKTVQSRLLAFHDLRETPLPREIDFRARRNCSACAPKNTERNTMATIRIPTPLRKLTAGKQEVEASGKTIAELISDLEANYPGIKARICDDDGNVRRFVNIFANQEDIRFLQNLDTPVGESDEVSIVPAIAGGAPEGVPRDTP